MLMFDHFLGPNNVGNMASAAGTPVQRVPSSLEPSTMARRSDLPGKRMCESILNAIMWILRP
jgi:hypothetical protein